MRTNELYEAISTIPVVDIHTHLVGGKLGARGLHDILLYHMAVSDLYAAGCPDGARLTQFPDWPSEAEAHQRIQAALPYLPHVANTSTSWGIRLILKDLYDIDEPITADNWRAIDSLIRERADDRAWHREIMRRAGICRFGTEIARRGDGSDDDIFDYALEWAFFTRCQWGENDTALYELERCWGKTPESPTPIGGVGRPLTDRVIRTIDDVHEAMAHYVRSIPLGKVVALATHISTDLDLRPVTESDMIEALARRSSASPVDRNTYAAYINECFLGKLAHHADEIVFQFSLGAEPLPFETGSRLSQQTISQLGEMIARHPRIRFMCFLACQHANQAICTLCRELPNLSLAGYWWHNFFPSLIERIMAERLDMLPSSKQIGFFSDAYCIEWAYAKLRIVRSCMAVVLGRQIEQGRLSQPEALTIAGSLFSETPHFLLGKGIKKLLPN